MWYRRKFNIFQWSQVQNIFKNFNATYTKNNKLQSFVQVHNLQGTKVLVNEKDILNTK